MFRVLLAGLVAGCSAARPSTVREALRESHRARPPPELAPSSFVPPGAIHGADLSGVAESLDRTATIAFGLGFIDEEDDRPGPEIVPPILAVTGTVTFDIPMADDERVGQWIEYLTGRGREWYAKWLGRSTRYVPIFWPILDQYGLPRDLVFLSMIESGFSPHAYSWAHAAGPWQFIVSTGREYGLEVGFWVDERRDFELATHAAARYLRRLQRYYDGDWYLAWAAYNAGVGRVDRAARNMRSRDFWRLSRSWYLRRETKHYVPKLLAAATIAKQPDEFGFDDVVYLPPLRWEILTVTVATDLGTIARACGLSDHAELVTLNPALRTEVTPPSVSYPVRVPSGLHDRCSSGLVSLGPERMTYRYAEVSAKDSIEAIAGRFRTTPQAILQWNGIQREQLGDFDEIVVPVPIAAASEVPIVDPPFKRYRPNRYGPEGAQLVVYEVQPGDSLWRIARRYRVSLQKLRLWNGLWKATRLAVGQKIRVYLGAGRGPGHPGFRRGK
jgi:membrane-bound lytic murein transglycosylase D